MRKNATQQLESDLDELLQVCDIFMHTEESLQKTFGGAPTQNAREIATRKYKELKDKALQRSKFSAIRSML